VGVADDIPRGMMIMSYSLIEFIVQTHRRSNG